MPERDTHGSDRALESQVLQIMARQLDQNLDPSEKSTIYGIIGEILQRDLELERGQREGELQLDLRAREDWRHSSNRAMYSILGLSMIGFAAGITLALKGFQDIGLFLLGCTTAFLGEARVGELRMRQGGWKSIAVLGVGLFCGGLTLGALIFAHEFSPGEGLRQILVFLAGMLTVAALANLSRAVTIERTEDPLPLEVSRPKPPASSPPAPPASSASPS